MHILAKTKSNASVPSGTLGWSGCLGMRLLLFEWTCDLETKAKNIITGL